MHDICNRLKASGFRVTTPRKLVLSALKNKPQTAHEIENEIKLGSSHVDTATIYRNLEVLIDLGVVRRVNINNTALFELVTDNNHHHHLVCSKCGNIDDICMDESYLLKSVAKYTKFKVQDHTLEFFGLCVNCQ